MQARFRPLQLLQFVAERCVSLRKNVRTIRRAVLANVINSPQPLVAQRSGGQGVGGSNPLAPTIKSETGSNPNTYRSLTSPLPNCCQASATASRSSGLRGVRCQTDTKLGDRIAKLSAARMHVALGNG